MMLVLELCVLSLLSQLHRAVSTCQKWDISSQSKDQSLFLYFSSGRFSARLHPYVIFLILRYLQQCASSPLNNDFCSISSNWGSCVSNNLRYKGETRIKRDGWQEVFGLRHQIFWSSSLLSAARWSHHNASYWSIIIFQLLMKFSVLMI